MNTHMDTMENEHIQMRSEKSEEATFKATNLHELLFDEGTHWSVIIRKDSKLKFLRDIFRRRMKGKINYQHMTTFLISSDLISNVSKTVVSEEIDKISKSLMSSRNRFELRKLKTKRKLITLQDCFIFEEETRKTIQLIFNIFGLENYIGEINCSIITEWAVKALKSSYPNKRSTEESCSKFPNFVYKEASFARAFRAKKVMEDHDPSSKRKIQTAIINNLRAGICWWILTALRQVIIPIRDKNIVHNVWRYGYLTVLKNEMKIFKMRYKVKQLDNHLNRPSINPKSIGKLNFSIVGNKLRPIIRISNQNGKQDRLHTKKVNSLLTWCLEQNGGNRRTIKDSCKIVSDFLRKVSGRSHIYAYTADVAKCFSLVQHRKLLDIIKRLLTQKYSIWVTCGKGKDDKGFTKLLFCSAGSSRDAIEKLKMSMKRKRVEYFETYYVHEHTTTWLLQQLQSTIGSYYYQRGEAVFRVTKGVPQGHPLSSILAFAYLNNFEKEYWIDEKNDPRIVYSRYEDDYIVITTQKNIFQKMMKPLVTGRNNHFLRVNTEKLKKSEKGEDIEWCGVRINLKEIKFSHRRLLPNGVKRRVFLKL